MPDFTIESTYWLPVFRHRTYQADTAEEACQIALKDPDWSERKDDEECAGETYVSGIWHGANAAFNAPSVRVPAQFSESLRRRAEHFEILLGILQVLLKDTELPPAMQTFWRHRAEEAVARGEAILAGAPDPH